MFDRLIDLIVDFISLFFFVFVIDQYEEGIVLRMGKATKKSYGPGWYFKIPFGIDAVLKETVVFATKDLAAQSITTKDNINIVISAMVSYRVKDIRKLLLEVDNADSVMSDASRGGIRKVIVSKTWQEIQEAGENLDEELTKSVRRQAFKWGIEIDRVQLSDLARTKTMRIVHDGVISAAVTNWEDD